MKKFMMTAVAVAFMLILAMPAMAIEFEVEGHFYTEGVYNEHPDLRDNRNNDYLAMELRLQPEFTFSDNLKLITRFDALGRKWGNSDNSQITSENVALYNAAGTVVGRRTTTSFDDDDEFKDDANIDWDWAYLQMKTSIGLFLVGRKNGGTWGNSFADSENAEDRITWVVPINNLYLAAVYEKDRDFDSDDVFEGNGDNDKYYISGTYRGDGFKAGLLFGYYRYRTFQDMAQAADTAAAQQLANAAGYDLANYIGLTLAGFPPDGGILFGDILAAGIDPNNIGATTDGTAILLSPYIDGKFGPVGVKAELQYVDGEGNYRGLNNAGTDSKDVTLTAYNLEGSVDVGPVTFQAGYAFASGDANYMDDEVEAFGYLETGHDWAKTLILYSDIVGLETTLGGLGNLVGGGKAAYDGFKVYYFGVDYNVMENLTVGGIVAKSKADDVIPGWDDDHGLEYDLTLNWKIFDNLTYTATYAQLDAGDYWEAGVPGTKVEDTFVLYHKLELLF